MKIGVVGLGYEGLPASCVLAQAGHEVLGMEIRCEVVEGLNQGAMLIDEPGLHVLLQEALDRSRFRAQATPESAEAFILCVPTPFQTGYQPDLSYVEAVARSLLPVLKEGDLVALESTIPVGATVKVAALYGAIRPELTDDKLHVAHCPELLFPGSPIDETIGNRRVANGNDPGVIKWAVRMHRSSSQDTVASNKACTAELVKPTENTFFDFSNLAAPAAISLSEYPYYSRLCLARSRPAPVGIKYMQLLRAVSLVCFWASSTKGAKPCIVLLPCSIACCALQISIKVALGLSNWIARVNSMITRRMEVVEYA